MTDMMSTLKTLLGDNADAKIQNAITALGNSGLLNQIQQSSNNAAPASPSGSAQTVGNSANPGNADSSANAAQSVSAATDKNISVSNNVSAQGNENNGGNTYLTPEGMQFVGQIRNMVEQMSNTNDSRSNLLRSLRPFMRTDRQRSIDRAIRLINIGRFSGLFGR